MQFETEITVLVTADLETLTKELEYYNFTEKETYIVKDI